MAHIERLFLIVHLSNPLDPDARAEAMARWHALIEDAGPREENAACILSSGGRGSPELAALVQDRFGDRCVMDPCDEGPETQRLLGEDTQRLLRTRGRFAEWVPYELWTSTMARRWTEGLKRELRDRGHTYDAASLQVVSFGQQWAGCLTKYSMLMPKYLGVTRTPDVRADLSPGAGWPLPARFIERVPMARHVSLYLFETTDGRPMGQFLDGLRAIWEPPHVAVAQVEPGSVEVNVVAPNHYLRVEPATTVGSGELVADVGDGCQPRFGTLLGNKGEYEPFKAALAAARIEPRVAACLTGYAVLVPAS